MNYLAKVICFLLLVGTTFVAAQSESVLPVVDISEAGAPLRIAGRVTAKDQPSQVPRYSFEGDIEMSNVSGKPILLMVVTLEVVSALPVSLNYREERDYFFESKTLQPGASAKLQRGLGKFGEPSRKEDFAVEVKPSARARVTFVQFSDGSSWGDASAAEQVLRNRQLSLKQLELLDEDYRKRTGEEFLSEFLQPTFLQPIFGLQELYREKRDLAPVLARLDDMLENARARSTQ
jgi:hypothetical protein